MAPATARTKPPALMNQATPGLPLWNVTSPVRPDPIPRARHARATPELSAHSLLAHTLLHMACSCTPCTLHCTAPRTRLGARPAAAPPTGTPVGLGSWRPAFMMLEATSTTSLACIYDAGQICYWPNETRFSEQRPPPQGDVLMPTPRSRDTTRQPSTQESALVITTKRPTHYVSPVAGDHMKGEGRASQRGRGGARQGPPEDPSTSGWTNERNKKTKDM